MSRARNIKPGFFKNELLVELPFEYRLLFIGLWTMADRAGRLEDRPTKIRMELFPADAVDVDAGLQALHEAGFILRYQVGDRRLIQVLAWSKHQNPHMKEVTSTIPAPGEHGAGTVQASESPVRAGLIPDSGFLDSSTSVELPPHTERTIGSPDTDSAPEDAVGAFEGHPPADTAKATEAGLILVGASLRIRAAGCEDVSASSPHLIQALADGIRVEELCDIAAGKGRGKGIAYLVKTARGLRADAAATAGAVPAAAGSTRNPLGTSPRKSPEQEAADRKEALAAQERQFRDLGYASH